MKDDLTTGGKENPFRSHLEPQAAFANVTPTEVAPSSGYVRHISIVAILLICNSILMLLAGSCAVVFAVAFSAIPEMAEQADAVSEKLVMVIYGGIGGLLVILGVLQLVAGIRNFGFHNRILGMVALCGGILSILTFFCGLTSIALAVYGLVVYLQPDCKRAFEMRAQGHSKEETLSEFYA